MTTRVVTGNRLFILGIFLSCLAALSVGLLPSPWFSLAGVFCIFLFSLLLVNVSWGIYFLLFASVCTAISFEVGPFTVRPEQVITLVLASVLFLLIFSGKRYFYRSSLDFLIFGYLLLNIFSSLLHSPDVHTSLQKCALLSITFLAFFVSIQLLTTKTILSNVIKVLVIVGVFEAIYGIVSVILFTSGVDIGGAHAPYGDVYARGTFIEGNIFGSFEMMVSLILVSCLLSKSQAFSGKKGLIILALVITLVASIMSFTRAAWLGFVAGFAAYLLFLRRQLIVRALNYLPIIMISFVLLCGVAYSLSVSIKKGNVSLMQIYVERFQKILDYRTTRSASSRVKVWRESLRLWQRNPILGNGTDSIKSLAVGTKMPMFGKEYWIPNSMISSLHDTGILGLALFCLIQIVFLVRLRIAIRRTPSAYYRAVLGGFFAAFVGAQVAYFFTNAFWLVFIWIFMAIGISFCRQAVLLPDSETD